MRIVLTGSSGRIGRAIFGALASKHNVIGVDRAPFATTRMMGDITDKALLQRALDGADVVIHTAALHAPNVGTVPDQEFERINVEGTRLVAEVARASGVGRIVFTSTTALYGSAVAESGCTWVDEQTSPEPESIYHRTKLAAETLLADVADHRLTVRVLRMSRCFPEPADMMAAYRLYRGIDARDVADAHALAVTSVGKSFERYVISGSTPFSRADCAMLSADAPALLRERVPALVDAFDARGWKLPQTIDRVYVPLAAKAALGWQTRYSFGEVLAQLDRRSIEVLPVGASISELAE